VVSGEEGSDVESQRISVAESWDSEGWGCQWSHPLWQTSSEPHCLKITTEAAFWAHKWCVAHPLELPSYCVFCCLEGLRLPSPDPVGHTISSVSPLSHNG
jgi:hypothetical protein